MNPITVLLAEDHKLVREGLRAMLDEHDDFEVVGEAENGYQAMAMVNKLCPDVVVMDVSMPLLDGLKATEHILQTAPSTRVLVLTAHSEGAYVEEAIALGASGYLTKQMISTLPDAIREVDKRRPFFSLGTQHSKARETNSRPNF